MDSRCTAVRWSETPTNEEHLCLNVCLNYSSGHQSGECVCVRNCLTKLSSPLPRGGGFPHHRHRRARRPQPSTHTLHRHTQFFHASRGGRSCNMRSAALRLRMRQPRPPRRHPARTTAQRPAARTRCRWRCRLVLSKDSAGGRCGGRSLLLPPLYDGPDPAFAAGPPVTSAASAATTA